MPEPTIVLLPLPVDVVGVIGRALAAAYPGATIHPTDPGVEELRVALPDPPAGGDHTQVCQLITDRMDEIAGWHFDGTDAPEWAELHKLLAAVRALP